MQKITILLVLVLSLLTQYSFSQKTDSTKNIFHFKGAITVTNKGISLIPTFTLGKPAAIFDLSMGKKKLFFEPQLKFSLKGKPWSFLFWWRYKLITDKKFSLTIGGHPAINFRTDSFFINGAQRATIVARRYLAGELVPNYFISKNVSVGLYYLYGRGLDHGTIRNDHFLTINANFSHIKLGDKFFARFTPQLYYLNQDGKDGFYFTSSLTLVKRNFPISFQSTTNKIIQTNVPGSQDFLLNFSLIYSFNKTYVNQK
ncbi:MAG TPA: hypothetical protein VKB95_11170 [Chitinophagaceae bacterium]|nr:hypothetical protein [Chitinophagaceae bacterium]